MTIPATPPPETRQGHLQRTEARDTAQVSSLGRRNAVSAHQGGEIGTVPRLQTLQPCRTAVSAHQGGQ